MRRRATKSRHQQRLAYLRYYKATALYKPRKWTKREEVILAESLDTNRELSRKLRRSISSIQKKRRRLADDGVHIARYWV